MILDQSKKMYFGKYSSFNSDSVSQEIEQEIAARTCDTEKLQSLVKKRILELNELLEKIIKLEKRIKTK